METGLDRFVHLDKPSFIGKDALLARQAEGPHRRLVTLRVVVMVRVWPCGRARRVVVCSPPAL